MTDGKGQKTSYTYDNLDRITQILSAGATSCSSRSTCTSFIYDGAGNLTSRTDATGTTTFAYDSLNRLTRKSLPDATTACAGSNPAGITFNYDLASNLTAYCDAGGQLSYGYDAANRLGALAEPGGSQQGGICTASPCSHFLYNDNDRRTQAVFPGGATLNLSYDNAGNQTTAVGKDANQAVLTSFRYSYNTGTKDTALRQTVAEADQVFTGTTTYGYDAFNRLTSATNTKVGNLSYGYDPAGNRTSDNSGTYSYNPADELTASPGVANWSYDANGNLIGNAAGASISYNSQNQSTAITYGGQTLSPLSYADVGQTERVQAGSTSYASSSFGVQIARTGGSSTYYTRDNQGNLLGERTASHQYYYLKDALGSMVAVINGNGTTVANRYGYDPYGKSTYKTETASNPWQYAGGYVDSTGLIKFGARYYDPGLGRWTQRDPIAGNIANPSSQNRYPYIGCNPVNASDPSGTSPCGAVSLFLGGVATGGAFIPGYGVVVGTTLGVASFIFGYMDLTDTCGGPPQPPGPPGVQPGTPYP